MQDTLFEEFPAGVTVLRNFISPDDQRKLFSGNPVFQACKLPAFHNNDR